MSRAVTMQTTTLRKVDARTIAIAHVQATCAHYLAERDWFRYWQAAQYLRVIEVQA